MGVADQVRQLCARSVELRHRHDRESWRHAVGAAAEAATLARLPGQDDATLRPAAELHLASSRLVSGDPEVAGGLAQRWADDADPNVSGWAWVLLGRIRHEEGIHFAAIADLQNAIAEYRRGSAEYRERCARIELASCLSSVGQLAAAAGLLQEDAEYWRTGSRPLRRLLSHLLARAENERLQGRIDDALATLDVVEDRLTRDPQLTALRHRMHLQRAACFTEWHQVAEARRALRRAARVAVPEPSARASRPISPPPSEPTTVAVEPLGVASALATPLDPVETVMGIVTGIREGALVGEDTLAFVKGRVGQLHGLAGAERTEATVLLEVGRALPLEKEALALEAERLLRRAEVRLEHLTGMGLQLAHCHVALARVCQRRGRLAEGLALGLRGLEGLERERMRMGQRQYRAAWTGSSVAAAYDLAVELALATGRPDLASDLIIRSRVAGVVQPGSVEGTGRVGLAAPPRFSYIDGTVSTLPGEGETRFE